MLCAITDTVMTETLILGEHKTAILELLVVFQVKFNS